MFLASLAFYIFATTLLYDASSCASCDVGQIALLHFVFSVFKIHHQTKLRNSTEKGHKRGNTGNTGNTGTTGVLEYYHFNLLLILHYRRVLEELRHKVKVTSKELSRLTACLLCLFSASGTKCFLNQKMIFPVRSVMTFLKIQWS